MQKTTVYLHDEELEGLRRLAAATGQSQAELIRKAVRTIVGRGSKRKFHSLGLGHGTGEPRPRWSPDELHARRLGRR